MKHIRVMYEVNLHVTLLSVRNVTNLLRRKVRGCIQWECSFRKRKPLLHTGLSASNNCGLMGSFFIKESQIFLSFIEHQLQGKKT